MQPNEIKAYFEQVQKKIIPLSEVVYFEALKEKEVVAIEEELGLKIRSILREFLLNFGFTQDVVKKWKLDKEEMKEDLKLLREAQLTDYIPIKTKMKDYSDVIFALKNNDVEKDNIHEIEFDEKGNLIKVTEKKKTFSEVVMKAVNKIKVNKRCKNSSKVRVTEFKVYGAEKDFLAGITEANVKQVTKWSNKYYPDNIFGDQIAKYEMFDKIKIDIQRNESKSMYTFEIEEPVETNREKSLIKSTEEILERNNVKYDTIILDIVETE